MNVRTLLLAALLAMALFGVSNTSIWGQVRPGYFGTWYFGDTAGIAFNGSGGPAPLLDGRMGAWEGCAAISDPHTGALLFYTDGVTVWNRHHQIMQNGAGLRGNFTSTQSALIVPKPGSSTIFYIFTAESAETPTPPEGYALCYSIVDMTLDGGTGAVTGKNIVLFYSCTEKLTATRHCNDRNYWVVAHEAGTNRFRSYRVDENGIANPVISSVGPLYPDKSPGMLKFSPNGMRLASARISGIELYAFDKSSGSVSDPLMVESTIPSYGVAFSPDNSKLYASGRAVDSPFDKWLYQFDLSSNDPTTIARSRYTFRIQTGMMDGGAYGMQLGPDGRLYVALYQQGSLGVVSSPDLPAPACGFVQEGIVLGGRKGTLSLPNCIDSDLFPTAPARIARDYKVFPGNRLHTPLELQAPVDNARVRHLRISFSFDPSFIQLRNADDPADLLRGTLLDGWIIESFLKESGTITIALRAPDASSYLQGSGPLLNPELQVFLNPKISSELDITIELPDNNCEAIHATAGLVTIDSLCAIHYRMIERRSPFSKITLEQNQPNPFSSSTSMVLAAPAGGHVQLEIIDARGGLITTLINDEVTPGKHEVSWDASEHPNGLYFCRLLLEGEMRTLPLLLKRE